MIRTHNANGGQVWLADAVGVETYNRLAALRPKPILICADPPYFKITNNAWDTQNLYMQVAKHAATYLPVGGSLLVWGGVGKPKQRVFFQFLAGVVTTVPSLHMHNLITWGKLRGYGTSTNYLFTREELAWFVKGSKPKVFNIPLLDKLRGYEEYDPKYPAKSAFKRRTNVWTDIPEILRGKVHECEKPIPLCKVQIATHSNPGDLVIDMFSGSGNMAKACQALDRQFISIENDPTEFKKICSRL